VTFATSTGDLLSDLISTAEIVVDGEVIGSENITTSYNDDGVVVFDSLNWDIDAGDTVDVIVRVDMRKLNTGTFGSGATLSATVNPDDTGWDIEDEEGENLSASDKTGSASSDAHAFYADGINVVMKSVSDVDSPVDSTNNDYTTLTIKFDVTAYGEDAYIPSVTTATLGTASASSTYSAALADGVIVHVQSSDSDIASSTPSVTLTSTADEESNSFKVKEGSGNTETFTLKVVVSNFGTGDLDNANVRAILQGVNFADTNSATGDFIFTSNVTDIKTDYGYIAD